MDATSEFYEVLKQKRENIGLSISEVSKKTSISTSHISRIENGKRKNPSYHIIEKLNDLYSQKEQKIPLKFMETEFIKIPLVGSVKAGFPAYCNEEVTAFIEISSKIKADFALKIDGDSMNDLNIKNNDIIFIRKQDFALNGEIVVVLIDNQEATLKQFYKNGDNVTLIPRSKNPDYFPLVFDTSKTNIKILGKVISAYIGL